MKKFLLALLTAVTAAALFCGAAASVATYSASYDAPAGINAIVVQDSSAAVILQAADIDHIRADYTYTSSYAFESSKLYDFAVAGSTPEPDLARWVRRGGHLLDRGELRGRAAVRADVDGLGDGCGF